MADNDYYQRLSEMNPGELADGLALEAEFDAIWRGFGKLPTPHRDGHGFEGPVRVGDATAPDEAINKKQLDEALGTAKQLAVAIYGNFNAAAWATLPSGTYLLFGTGSQITNSPFTLAAAKTYYLAVRHAIGDNLYFDAVVMSSLDDDAHVDIGREAWRAGPALAPSAWRAAALKTGALAPLEVLTPAADKIAVFNGPAGAELITLTAYMRTLLDDTNATDAKKTLQLPTAGGFGLRNKLINGGMQVAQRGGSGTVPAGSNTYTLDRWNVYSNNQTVAWSQQGGPSGASGASLLFNGAANTEVIIRQRIEARNCLELVGNKVTLSYYLYGQSAAAVKVTPSLNVPTAADNFTGISLLQSAQPVTVPGPVFTKFSFTFDALPASVLNGLEVAFTTNRFNTGAVLAISNVQLEVGEVATPFEHRSYGQELAVCQRYFVQPHGTSKYIHYKKLTWASVPVFFPVRMRAAPTVAVSNLTSLGDVTGYGLNSFEDRFFYSFANGNEGCLETNWTASAEL
ncbi:hypothetical protein [Aeromonas hydrophila]|uniref:hypothetical protein n=1 Tax=Aeromonas hydrophila TaxID=644 RepID=UPI003D20AE74